MVRVSWNALRERPFVFPVIFLCVGAAAADPSALPFSITGALFLAFVLFSLLFSMPWGRHAALLAASACLGLCLSTGEGQTFVPSWGDAARLTGVIEHVEASEQGTYLRLRVDTVDEQPARFIAGLSSDGTLQPALAVGQRIAVSTKLKPYAPASNPGEINNDALYRHRGQRFRGSFEAARVARLSAPAAWRQWLAAEHSQLSTLAFNMAPDRESAALFLTLASGARETLSPEAEVAFSRSGLAHVLSVSGLHVAALALALSWLLRWALVRTPLLWLRQVDARRLAALACLPLLWAYVIFTGAQAPAVRSAVMASAYFAGVAMARQSDGLNAVALAAGVMVALSPSSLFELSLQLSFLAVLSLLLLVPKLESGLGLPKPSNADAGRLAWLKRFTHSALRTAYASVAVTLATLPLLASAFGQLSVVSVVANMLALPLSGALAVLAAAAALASVCGLSLAVPLVWLGTHAAYLFQAMTYAFAAPSFAAVAVPPPEVGWSVSWYLLLAVWCLAAPRPSRIAGYALLPCLFFLSGFTLRPSADTLQVTFLAVGHGDATVVSYRGQHVLIDGGGVPRGADTGRRYVLPYLRKRGIASLDLTVLSHAHPDHALGLASTLREITTKRLWLSAASEPGALEAEVITAARGATVERIEQGHPPFWLGKARVEVVGPPKERALLESENDRSSVLRLDYGEVSFLLTGDIEEAAEQSLSWQPVTVLKAPHHGSRTSSTPGFVASTQPRYVVFCVGRQNRYHLPSDEVVQRYENIGAHCYRTDRDGAVTFRTDGHALSVETFLEPAEPAKGSP
ncbi:MAG: DNA internalization-related competence protein ComEC/Rec2 [Myxococcaceae bacterium]|nr:DNA internalization-related competence protein ComEC/Rec2 [Myxococcaceae bacterium]